jgi:Raf kinase inhibitor-like YbhB/YbcL family protein
MLKLTSSAFQDGKIEKSFGNLGSEENMKYGIPQTSFPLTWEGAPSGTQSYAIVFIDYDDTKDEGFPFIHWLVCDIPASKNGLTKNASRDAPDFHQGHNSWCIPYDFYKTIPEDYSLHFGGPAPEYAHEYELWLYALDYMPDLEDGFWYNDLRRAMKGHVLEKTFLSGFYG